MTTTTLPSLRERGTTIKDLLLANSDQIKMALPRFLPLDRLIRTALTVISTTPGLLDCSPRSLLGAVIQCAQLGLEPGVLGQAYLIPFKNNRTGKVEVQFIPGYRGLLALARRTGDISTVQSHVVHSKDLFVYNFGTDPQIRHVPTAEADPGPITHIYAVVRLKDGAVQFDVMTKTAIDQHRDRYSKAAKNGPWVTAWDEMAKKTVLRRLLKLAPASVDMQTAIVLDERAEMQLPQDLDALPEGAIEVEGGPVEETPTSSALDQLAEKMAGASTTTEPEPSTDDVMKGLAALTADVEALRAKLGYTGDVWTGLVKEHAGVSLGLADTEQLGRLRDYLAALTPKG